LQVEGPVTPSELVEILQRTIDAQRAAFRASMADEQDAAFRASRAEEEERRTSALRRLRQEQDAAYLESLQKDQVLSPCRVAAVCCKMYMPCSDMLPAMSMQEKERSTKSLQDGIGKSKPSQKYTGQAATETAKKAQIRAPTNKETAPSHRTEANTKVRKTTERTWYTGVYMDHFKYSISIFLQIMIRFPNGERKQQSFRHTDTIREIYKYVNSLCIPGIGQYQLVRSYPRKTYGRQQLEMTLGDAGFHPSVTLYIEQVQ
jgi:FAS-associated factor 2